MAKAREIARGGACANWLEILCEMSWDDRASLYIWMSGSDQVELDKLCHKHRIPFR